MRDRNQRQNVRRTAGMPLVAVLLHVDVRVQMVEGAVRLGAAGPVAGVEALDFVVASTGPLADGIARERDEGVGAVGEVARRRAEMRVEPVVGARAVQAGRGARREGGHGRVRVRVRGRVGERAAAARRGTAVGEGRDVVEAVEGAEAGVAGVGSVGGRVERRRRKAVGGGGDQVGVEVVEGVVVVGRVDIAPRVEAEAVGERVLGDVQGEGEAGVVVVVVGGVDAEGVGEGEGEGVGQRAQTVELRLHSLGDEEAAVARD